MQNNIGDTVNCLTICKNPLIQLLLGSKWIKLILSPKSFWIFEIFIGFRQMFTSHIRYLIHSFFNCSKMFIIFCQLCRKYIKLHSVKNCMLQLKSFEFFYRNIYIFMNIALLYKKHIIICFNDRSFKTFFDTGWWQIYIFFNLLLAT